MDALTLDPVARVNGSVEPPGSKSISNRALPLAALAEGTTRVLNLPDGEDVELMRKALAALGVGMAGDLKDLAVKGRGKGFANPAPVELFLGNSGTTTRTLDGLAGGGRGRVRAQGVPACTSGPSATWWTPFACPLGATATGAWHPSWAASPDSRPCASWPRGSRAARRASRGTSPANS